MVNGVRVAVWPLRVRNRRIGRDVGSDHLPVILELVVPE